MPEEISDEMKKALSPKVSQADTDTRSIRDPDPRDPLVRHLRSQGLSTTGISALLGNIEVETGGQFSHETVERGTVEGDTPARGLFQFESDGLGLQAPYDNYLKDTGRQDSQESQLQFIVDVLMDNYDPGAEHIGRGNIQKVREAIDSGDLQRATEEFSNRILRPSTPHMDRRLQAAQRAQKDFFNESTAVQIEKRSAGLKRVLKDDSN